MEGRIIAHSVLMTARWEVSSDPAMLDARTASIEGGFEQHSQKYCC